MMQPAVEHFDMGAFGQYPYYSQRLVDLPQPWTDIPQSHYECMHFFHTIGYIPNAVLDPIKSMCEVRYYYHTSHASREKLIPAKKCAYVNIIPWDTEIENQAGLLTLKRQFPYIEVVPQTAFVNFDSRICLLRVKLKDLSQVFYKLIHVDTGFLLCSTFDGELTLGSHYSRMDGHCLFKIIKIKKENLTMFCAKSRRFNVHLRLPSNSQFTLVTNNSANNKTTSYFMITFFEHPSTSWPIKKNIAYSLKE
ncbi:hypothetical protein ACOME3_002346 [Neoechinorhynchus agilis]